MGTSFTVVWDGTKAHSRYLTTTSDTAGMPQKEARRVHGTYSRSDAQRVRVLGQLILHGPQTRIDLMARTGLTADQMRTALSFLLLQDKIRVCDRAHMVAKGRCRFVYEAICKSSQK